MNTTNKTSTSSSYKPKRLQFAKNLVLTQTAPYATQHNAKEEGDDIDDNTETFEDKEEKNDLIAALSHVDTPFQAAVDSLDKYIADEEERS
jgi:hypothetical protein